MTKKSVIGFLLVFLLIFFSEAIGQYCEEKYDVPFVPTKHKIEEQMLKVANVSKDDIHC